MFNRRILFDLILMVLVLALVTGCSPSATPAPTITAPTAAASAMPTTPATIATSLPMPTAQAPAATATPTSAPTASAARIAVQLPDNSVQLVDTSGNRTPLAKLDGQVDLATLLLAQNTLGSAIYLPVAGPTPVVMRVDAGGAQKLDWIKGPINGLAVSGTRLAWGTSDLAGNPSTSQVVISGLDGSQLKTILKETYSGIPQSLRPLRWSQDGQRLYFSQEPSGLGGYILFGGITNLWSYDLRDGKTTEIVHERSKNAAICIDDLAPNEQILVDHCSVKNIQVTALSDKKTTVYNPPSNIGPIGLVGGARFSPDGTVVAYGLARREPDNEQGWVAITYGFSGDSKLVATSPAKDYFSVATWLDDETIVLQSGLQTPGVWIVRGDGSGLKRLADGTFLGIVGGASATPTTPATIATSLPMPTAQAPAATATPTAPTTTSETYALPAQCYREGLPTFVDDRNGICFAYPLRFTSGKNGQRQGEVLGPSIGKGPEPLFSSLTVEVKPAGDKELKALVDEYLVEFKDIPIKIERKPLTLSGEPAEVLEPVPGRLSSRVVLVRHLDRFYILWFWPSFRDTPPEKQNADMKQAQKDADALYEIVTASLGLMPVLPLSSEAGQPVVNNLDLPASCVVPGQSLYVNTNDNYCFAFPGRFTVSREATGQPGLYGPALDRSLDPVRATMGVEVEVAAKGRTVDQIVGDLLGEYGKLNIPPVRTSPMTVGGQPAVLLEGVPGRGMSRDVLMLHNGTLYHFKFQPDVQAPDKAAPDVEALFKAVTYSFALVPASKGETVVMGQVFWGPDPVPNARVELRNMGWQEGPKSTALAQATADAQGQFRLVSPPVGRYDLVALWPDGKQLGAGTQVAIAAGTTVSDVKVYLVKEVTLLEPAEGVEVGVTPTLRWQSFPGANLYRVVMVDRETMEGFVGEDTRDTSLTVQQPLKPGRTYTWIVNAMTTPGMHMLAVASREIKVKP